MPLPPSGQRCTTAQAELAEESKAEAVAQALKAAGKTTIPVPRGDADKGNTDQGAAKKEREQKLHRLTRKKRRRILAREADERQAKEEAEELKAQGMYAQDARNFGFVLFLLSLGLYTVLAGRFFFPVVAVCILRAGVVFFF